MFCDVRIPIVIRQIFTKYVIIIDVIECMIQTMRNVTVILNHNNILCNAA